MAKGGGWGESVFGFIILSYKSYVDIASHLCSVNPGALL